MSWSDLFQMASAVAVEVRRVCSVDRVTFGPQYALVGGLRGVCGVHSVFLGFGEKG